MTHLVKLGVLGAVAVLAACSSGGSQNTGLPITTTNLRRASSPFAAHCLSKPCIYVANGLPSSPSITIYTEKSNGNVAPIESIAGSNTKLIEPAGVGVDSHHNIYAGNWAGETRGEGSVTVYAAGEYGNVAPSQIIYGPPSGGVMILPDGTGFDSKDNIYVAGYMTDSVSVYPFGTNGDPQPSRYISGSNTDLSGPSGISVTPKGRTYITNYLGRSVTVYAEGATGNVAPIQMISGSSTGIAGPTGVGLDSKGNIYVSSESETSGPDCCVTVYSKNATGNVAPIRTISGSNTGLDFPYSIALDSKNNIYVVNYATGNSSSESITVYAAGANGNAKPIRTISGSNTGLNQPEWIVVH
jgi:hypothetical protein